MPPKSWKKVWQKNLSYTEIPSKSHKTDRNKISYSASQIMQNGKA